MSYHSFQSKRGRASLSKFKGRDKSIAIRAIRGQSFKEIGKVYGLDSSVCASIFRKIYRQCFPEDKTRLSLKKLKVRADEIVSAITMM